MNWTPTLGERLSPSSAGIMDALSAFAQQLRVSMPAIVASFDATKQTVSVQPATKETVAYLQAGGLWNTNTEIMSLPILKDIPIVLPRAGDFSITFPIQPGDECLVFFADTCIDAWWQAGGINNTQIEQRRHDLSDGFALFGPWSQPRVLSNYSTTSLQVRSDDGATVVDVQSGQITLTAQNVTVNASSTATIQAPTINIEGSTAVNITGGGNTKIENKTFLTHLHTGVTSGGSTSGPVA